MSSHDNLFSAQGRGMDVFDEWFRGDWFRMDGAEGSRLYASRAQGSHRPAPEGKGYCTTTTVTR